MIKPLCGPRLSVIGIILSIWGILMLGLLGFFFRIESPNLVEDLAVDDTVWASRGYSYDYLKELYSSASTNAFIAAALYILVLAFSFVNFQLNMRTRGAASFNNAPDSVPAATH